ncbi:MAG: O-antigen ligase family protein [Trueperaceae bacterium]|nr:O-antigen ligase family protein [Trueperaceae bacterium]
MPRTAHDARPDPGGTPSHPLRRVAIGAAAAWLLLSSASLAVGDAAGVAAAGVVLGVAVLAVAVARRHPLRVAGSWLIGAYAAGLTIATLVSGATQSTDDARIELFTGNPNVLGAALVTAMAAWAAVAPRRRWVWWAWPLVGLAVLNTGSRTSGGALLAAGTVWLVLLALLLPRRRLLAPLMALLVLVAAAFAWQRGVVELTPNLLAAPSDLTHPAWRSLARHLEIVPDAAPGPFEGTLGQRLMAQAEPERRSVLHQTVGRSEAGVPYVASIYLRADDPRQVELSSHLATVTCEVDEVWRRCVTPAAYGDDYLQAQLHLQVLERGGSVDVYVFGAQYERGETVTPFLDLRPAWIPQPMVNRYDLRRITFLPEDRVEIWRAGLDIARASPWFGVGLGAAADAFRERTREALAGDGVTYAHNLLVQLLAVHGVVGLTGALLFVGALLSTLSRAGWARLAPLLSALVLLNTWDLTLFEPFVFVPAVLALASWSGRSGPPLGSPRR